MRRTHSYHSQEYAIEQQFNITVLRKSVQTSKLYLILVTVDLPIHNAKSFKHIAGFIS